MASGDTTDIPARLQTTSRSRRKEAEVRDGMVGKALRGVYQETVAEAVPDDLLDLLGKLD